MVRSDLLLVVAFIVIIAVLAAAFLFWAIRNASRYCGDCRYFKKCHGNSRDRNFHECPACKHFVENKDYE